MLSAFLAPLKKIKQDGNLEPETGVGTGVQNPYERDDDDDEDDVDDDSSNIEDVDDDDLSVASNASTWSFAVNSSGKAVLKLIVDTKETETSGTLDLPLEKVHSVEATGTQHDVAAANNDNNSDSFTEASNVNDESASNIALDEKNAVEDGSVTASSTNKKKKKKSRKSKKKSKSKSKNKDKDKGKVKRNKKKGSSSRSNSPCHYDDGDNVESVDGQSVTSKSSKRRRRKEQVEPEVQSNVPITARENNEATADASLLIACCDDDMSVTSRMTTDEALVSTDDDNVLDSDDDDRSIGSMKLSEQESLLHISKQIAMLNIGKTKLSGVEKPLFGIDNDDDDADREEKKSEESDGEVSRMTDDDEMHSGDDNSDGEVSVASAWSLFATPQSARQKKKLSGALQTFLTESSLAAQKEKRLQEKATGSKSNPNIETSIDACTIQGQQPSNSESILGTMSSTSTPASKDKEPSTRNDSTTSALNIGGKKQWRNKLDDFLTESRFKINLDGDDDDDDVQSTFTDVSAIRKGKRISVAASRRKMLLRHQSSRRSGSFRSERSLSPFSRCPPKMSSGKSSRSLSPPQTKECKEIGTPSCTRNASNPTSVKHTRSASADMDLTKLSLSDCNPDVNRSKQEIASTMPSPSGNKTMGDLNDFFSNNESNPSRSQGDSDVHSVCTSLTAAKTRRSRKGGNFSIKALPDFDFPAAINNHKRSCSAGVDNSKPEIPSKKLERSATTGTNNSRSVGTRQRRANSPKPPTSRKASSNKPTSSLSSNDYHHNRQKSGGSNTKTKKRSDAVRRTNYHSRESNKASASLSMSQPIAYCHSTGNADHNDSIKQSAEAAFHESFSNSSNAFGNDFSNSNGSMTFDDMFDQSKNMEGAISSHQGPTSDQQSHRRQSCDSNNADKPSKGEEIPQSKANRNSLNNKQTTSQSSNSNHHSRQKSGGSNTKTKKRSDTSERINHHSRKYASLSASQPISYCHSTSSVDHNDSMKHSAEASFHESFVNSRVPAPPVDSDVKLFLSNAFSNDFSNSNGSMTFDDMFDQSKNTEGATSSDQGPTNEQQSHRRQSCESTSADKSSKMEDSPLSEQRKLQSSPSANRNRNSSHKHSSIGNYSTEVSDYDLIRTNKSKGSGHSNCENALDVYASSLSPQNDSTPQVAVDIKDKNLSPKRQQHRGVDRKRLALSPKRNSKQQHHHHQHHHHHRDRTKIPSSKSPFSGNIEKRVVSIDPSKNEELFSPLSKKYSKEQQQPALLSSPQTSTQQPSQSQEQASGSGEATIDNNLSQIDVNNNNDRSTRSRRSTRSSTNRKSANANANTDTRESSTRSSRTSTNRRKTASTSHNNDVADSSRLSSTEKMQISPRPRSSNTSDFKAHNRESIPNSREREKESGDREKTRRRKHQSDRSPVPARKSVGSITTARSAGPMRKSLGSAPSRSEGHECEPTGQRHRRNTQKSPVPGSKSKISECSGSAGRSSTSNHTSERRRRSDRSNTKKVHIHSTNDNKRMEEESLLEDLDSTKRSNDSTFSKQSSNTARSSGSGSTAARSHTAAITSRKKCISPCPPSSRSRKKSVSSCNSNTATSVNSDENNSTSNTADPATLMQ